MVTKARQKRVESAVQERQTWAGNELTFKVHGLESASSITIYAGRDAKLFDLLNGRKDIDLDFSSVKTFEEGQILREKFESTLDKPNPQDYPQAAEELDKASYRQTSAFYIQDIARAITYDLADATLAKVSDERYKNIVDYAKEIVRTLSQRQSTDSVHEPGRTPLQSFGDRIFGRDAMRHTKDTIQSLKRLFLSAEDDKTLSELSQNIPYERINSRVIHNKNADPVCEAFMKIYEEKTAHATEGYSGAYRNFCQAFVRLKVYTDALRTFDQKLKQHLSKLMTIEKVAQRKKENENEKSKRKAQNQASGEKIAAQQRRQASLHNKLTDQMQAKR